VGHRAKGGGRADAYNRSRAPDLDPHRSPENHAAAMSAVSERDASVLLGRMIAAAGARV
jgi:hypothetical protein